MKFLDKADQFRLKYLEADAYYQKNSCDPEQFKLEADIFGEPSYPQMDPELLHYVPKIKIEPLEEIENPLSPSGSVEVVELKAQPKPRTQEKKKRIWRGRWAPKNRPICRFCGKEQQDAFRMRQHELSIHIDISELTPDQIYVCDMCGRLFKTKTSISSHFIRAHTPKTETFPCPTCGKVLAHQTALYMHERVHVKTTNICQYCSKSFNRKSLLKSHIEITHLRTKT